MEHRVLAWCCVVLFAIPPGLGFYGFQIAKRVKQQWATQSDSRVLEEVHSSFTSGFSGFPSVLGIECDDLLMIREIDRFGSVVTRRVTVR